MKKMEMDLAHIVHGNVQTPQDHTDLESAREVKTREAKGDMENL